jgi:hypothetical protein
MFIEKKYILMIVTHPDDESLFGFSDIINNNCTIICLTQKNLLVRKNQFEKILEISNSNGVILDYLNSINDSWENISNEMFYNELKKYIKLTYDMIVSHDINGEYGHIRTHYIAKYISEKLNIPFYDFKTRFNKENYGDKHDSLLNIYIKEGLNEIQQPGKKLPGSYILVKSILKYKYFFGMP